MGIERRSQLGKLMTGSHVRQRPWDGELTPLQLALARGHRWLAMVESSEVKSLREPARRKGVDSSYVSRMVNLTTLGPDIVVAILDEALPPGLVAETPAHLLDDDVTPIERLFIRNNGLPPDRASIDAAAWRLMIDGESAMKNLR